MQHNNIFNNTLNNDQKLDIAVFLPVIALCLPILDFMFQANETLRAIIIGFLCCSAGFFLFLKQDYLSNLTKKIVIYILPFLCIYTVFSFFNLAILQNGIKITTQITLILIWFIFLCHIQWNKKTLIFFYNFVMLLVLCNLLGLIYNYQYGFTSFKNICGIYGFLGLFLTALMFLKNKNLFLLYVLNAILCFSLLFLVGSRGLLLSSIMGFVFFIVLNMTGTKKIILTFLSAIIFIGLLGSIYLYTHIEQLGYYDIIEQYVQIYTGQNFYSGRNIIWTPIIRAISENLYFGYGSGFEPQNSFLSFDETWSAHNLYMMIALQTGLIGLICWLFFAIKILHLITNQYSKTAILSAAFWIAIWFHQNFEVALTQSNLVIGILLWIVPAIGISLNHIYKPK
jgi:O-antigen ligase